jgi:SAM-dependent methyltransferase
VADRTEAPIDETLAPGVPPDYYSRIAEVEDRHWWHRGMRRITQALLGERSGADRLLDAGCGTGGFMRWALDTGLCAGVCGIDVSSAAIELARRRVPEADLHVAPLWELPVESAAYDLVVLNDVLQHIPEDKVGPSCEELGRALADGGSLLVRTNGARDARRERHDWRRYDATTLSATLEASGFRVERLTYANVIPSLWSALRGSSPHAPTETSHGIPAGDPSSLRSRIALGLLVAEARYLGHGATRLPYGHTLFAVAVPARPR